MKKSLLIFLLFLALPINAMQDLLSTELNQQLSSAAVQENPDLEQIHSLIAAKADINYISNNRSLLHSAASFGYPKACMILLELGASPNTNAQQLGWPTPLMAAICRNFTKISCLMIEKGADIHVKDSNDRNALWMACDSCLPEVCKLLIEKKADINIQDKIDHHTPLMIATTQWHTPLCKLLLKNNADLRIHAKLGVTPLTLAARMHAQDLILAMLNHVLFPSKTEAKFLMYSLFRLRTTNRIASELYRYQVKSLVAPWLLYGIATANRKACIDLLEMPEIHHRYAFEHYPITLLNPECIDETIQSLIQNQ